MTQTGFQTLKAAAAPQSTDTLLGALFLLDAKPARDEAERMTYAAIAEVIEERHGLDAAMDAIFTETFEGTYAAAITLALAAVSA